jgi:hypothetical protein
MKNILLIIGLALSFSLFSQSGTEMELSRFITAKIERGEAPSLTSDSDYGGRYKSIGPVPAGKVWKITGASAYSCILSLSIKGPQDSRPTPFRLIGDQHGDIFSSSLPIFITEDHEVFIAIHTTGNYSSSGASGVVSIIEYTVN